jgi:hypothetical protein
LAHLSISNISSPNHEFLVLLFCRNYHFDLTDMGIDDEFGIENGELEEPIAVSIALCVNTSTRF